MSDSTARIVPRSSRSSAAIARSSVNPPSHASPATRARAPRSRGPRSRQPAASRERTDTSPATSSSRAAAGSSSRSAYSASGRCRSTASRIPLTATASGRLPQARTMRTAAARSVRSRSPPISVPSSSSASSSSGAASAVRCTASRPASWPRAVSSTELRPVRGSSPRTEASSATSSRTISARCRDSQSCQASPACAESGLPGPLTPHSRPSSSSMSFRVRGAPSSRRARTWTRPSGKLPHEQVGRPDGQRRLPHTGRTGHDQHGAIRAPRHVEEPGQLVLAAGEVPAVRGQRRTARRAPGSGGPGGPALAEHRPVQARHRRTGLQAQLPGEQLPVVVVHRQRLRLTPGLVEGVHPRGP